MTKKIGREDFKKNDDQEKERIIDEIVSLTPNIKNIPAFKAALRKKSLDELKKDLSERKEPERKKQDRIQKQKELDRIERERKIAELEYIKNNQPNKETVKANFKKIGEVLTKLKK